MNEDISQVSAADHQNTLYHSPTPGLSKRDLDTNFIEVNLKKRLPQRGNRNGHSNKLYGSMESPLMNKDLQNLNIEPVSKANLKNT